MILKESYLTNLIKESIRETLNERTKSEKNLSDDEVSYRRDMKFADSIEDDYEDSIYDDEQEKHNDKLHKRRIKHHKATQNHKKKNIEENLTNLIKESIRETLNEKRSIKSKKLYDIIQQHGGIESNNGIFDIANMSDDDIIGVVDYNGYVDFCNKGYRKFAQEHNIDIDSADEIHDIALNDRTHLLAKLRGGHFDRVSKEYNQNRQKEAGDFEDLYNKQTERQKNKHPRKDQYVWNNKDAAFLFKNPYYRNGEGDWTPERKSEVMNNVRNGKGWWETNESKDLYLKNYIKESVKKILKENFNADTITFILNSPMNGQLNVQVPYDEFMNSKNKIDLLWKYCEQQNDVQLMNNGYFKVHPNDPHKNEIENNWR